MLARNVRGLSLLAVSAGLLLGTPSRSFAAEGSAAEKGATDAAGAKPEAKTGKPKEDKLKGRLPAYYADLVDGEQRTKIYEIQAQHDPEIKKLKDALNAAVAKRDAAIASILTPAQQEKLAKLQAEAKAKKAKAAMDEKDSDAKTASADKPAKNKPAEPAESTTGK